MPKVYVASSWRNERQPAVVEALRNDGYFVYDFRNPSPEDKGFQWSAIDPEWKGWQPEAFRDALTHPVAEYGFTLDMNALNECDICVLVMPCGRSAHLEAGYAAGAGKRVFILQEEPGEPELMYKIADDICVSIPELLTSLIQEPTWETYAYNNEPEVA